MGDVLELTRKLGREPNVDTALHIMQWELGDLAKSWTYSRWHPDLARAYKAEAKAALSGLVFQSEVVAKLLDTNILDLLDMGTAAVMDRIKEKEKKMGRFKSYVGEEKSG